jgi:hypothetical protein
MLQPAQRRAFAHKAGDQVGMPVGQVGLKPFDRDRLASQLVAAAEDLALAALGQVCFQQIPLVWLRLGRGRRRFRLAIRRLWRGKLPGADGFIQRGGLVLRRGSQFGIEHTHTFLILAQRRRVLPGPGV